MERYIAGIDVDILAPRGSGNGRTGKIYLISYRLSRFKGIAKDSGLVEHKISASES